MMTRYYEETLFIYIHYYLYNKYIVYSKFLYYIFIIYSVENRKDAHFHSLFCVELNRILSIRRFGKYMKK